MSVTPSPAATMSQEDTVKPAPRLTLQSRLEDLPQVWQWVEELSAQYSIPAQTQFAIQLCLEEALSNIIRHGYGGEPIHTITVDCVPAEAGKLLLRIEDQASPFDPLDSSLAEAPPLPSSIDGFPAGGQGIRFLHRFAGTLTYERIESGNRSFNRLTMGFVLDH